jgi:chemosensory pili system protein ChpA (sensor histidine kinase/response regulator)
MSTTEVTAAMGQSAHAEQDLGPLAWVLEELRKSLDGAVKATRRFVREAEDARGSDLAALDTSPLRTAKQQLHQAGGALDMVGMPQAALLLRAMESAVQYYVQKPGDCNDAVVHTLEKASFALLEFLEAVLAGQHLCAVALFPQYRDVHALYGNANKVHPADLWPVERRLRDPALRGDTPHTPLPYGLAQRQVLDAAVLQIVKGQDAAAASGRMRDICLGYAQAQGELAMRTFWKVAGAYFDAMAHGLLHADIYTKRMASRVLMVSVGLAKGEAVPTDRLLQDMLFFCAQAGGGSAVAHEAVTWQTVYDSFGLQRHAAVNYEQARFGRFDPALLGQARKRIAAATEIWSALAGGDVSKIKPAVDQFTLVTDSLTKLHPDSHFLASALMQVTHSVVSQGQAPSAEVAMEVATAVLYLQAAFASLDMADEAMATNAQTLAQRLHAVLAGQPAQPLEPWMEQLYRQVSEQQTMGSVVGELRITLGETEKLLDQYFRNPTERDGLGPVAGYLQQMRGVLSVLGLDQASLAMARMRQNVERLQAGDVTPEAQTQLFEKMGNSLGALGFLIDMLSYQRNMARKLYVFDEAEGELKLVMGRMRVRASDADSTASHAVLQARAEPMASAVMSPNVVSAVAQSPAAELAVTTPTSISSPAPLAAEVSAAVQPAASPIEADVLAAGAVPIANAAHSTAGLEVVPEDTDSELLGIFLEEAREVVSHGRAALQVLTDAPANLSEQTVLRRAFHTLKGSSRMVGLDEFGQAGWAMEQMLNAWLAEQKGMPVPMQQLAQQALDGFEVWVQAIEAGTAHDWQSAPFRASADAMRLDARAIALDMAAVQGRTASDVAAPIAMLAAAQTLAAEGLTLGDMAVTQQPETVAAPAWDAALSPIQPEPAETPDAPAEAPSEGQAWSDFVEIEALQDAQEPSLATLENAEEISFEEFDALLQAADQAQAASVLPTAADGQVLEPPVAASTSSLPDDADIGALDATMAGSAAPASHTVPALADTAMVDVGRGIKQVGGLSLPLPLFNVYLAEAEGWSSRLLDALTAWSEQPAQAQPAMANTWAHSLAGSSATVGFTALSDLARKLEHALLHVAAQPQGVPEQVQCFVHAAQDIRSMLHQFAAGMLPAGKADGWAQLQAILDCEVQQQPAGDADLHAPIDDPLAQPEVQDSIDAAIAKAMALDEEPDDDWDAFNVMDPDLFPIFEEEASELLPTLGAALREWAAHPKRGEARAVLLRTLHTIKGSARLAGALRMGEMAHRMESALEALDAETVTTEQIEPLFGRLDAMEADFNVLRAVGGQLAAEPGAIPVASDTALPAAEATAEATDWQAPLAPQSAPEAGPRLAPAALSAAQLSTPASAGHVRQAVQSTVRVRAQLLDRLINEAGEVMIGRSRLDQRVGSIKHSLNDLSLNLEKLRQQLRDVEVQAESQMQSRMQLSKEAGADFDPLEFDRFTRVQELTRMMAESVNDVATVQRNLQRDVAGAEDDLMAQSRQARGLQRDLLRTRMVEFDAISERLYAVVRVTSKEMGKQVKLGIAGGTIEMDRGMLERMVPAFEHLLRNCVDHGIEMPEQRKAVGKPVAGTISVQVQQDGNDVAISFTDDGAGLQVERIRDKALALGLVTADEVVDAARAAQLVFMPGFSTAQQLTGVSGRGIGMDVVRSEVQALGGRIETQTTPGAGSSFRLVLPLTTAVTQVVMLRAGDFSVGVPASLVEVVRRVSLADLEAAYRSGALTEGADVLPFYWAGAVWSQSARSVDDGAGKTRPVVIFRSASQRIALHVDEVLGHQEVVVKHLGPQMARLPGLTGMSVLASGAVVLIYNPVALTAVYGTQIAQLGQGLPAFLSVQAAKQMQPRAAAATPLTGMVPNSQVPLVMVVDDSITVRRVSQRLLQREGYRVVTAADGLQALEKLQGEMPCVVLSDIEMPRMDGFDLLRNIRAQAQWQQLPIIMITSRTAQKHRDHALELGANHYLGKPYSDEQLMELVHHYALGKPLPSKPTVSAVMSIQSLP